MIISTTSLIMRKIWTFFVFIIIFIAIFLLFLREGIRLEHISLPQFKIEQLYIKFDKKLILSAKSVTINTKSNTQTSLQEIQKTLALLPFYYSFFDYISIRELSLGAKTIHFLFKDEVFYIDTDFLTLDAKIHPQKNTLDLQIKQMILKDYFVEFRGKLSANSKEKKYDFNGTFNTFNIDGALDARIENNRLFYRLNTQKFDSLAPFMDMLSQKVDLKPLVLEWIYKRIIAKEYKLDNLEGMFDLQTRDYYPKFIKASAQARDVAITFHKDIAPAKVAEVLVKLTDDTLSFYPKGASYEQKDLSESNVHIYNLLERGSGIVVDLHANTTLDYTIQKILKAFNIPVPIVQTRGNTRANLLLDIGFFPIAVKHYKGSFLLKDSNVSISQIPMYSKFASVQLEDGLVNVAGAHLAYDTLFDINTSGIFDTAKGIYASQNRINSLGVNFGQFKFLDVKNVDTNATLYSRSDSTTIDIEALKTSLVFAHANNQINIKDISTFYPHVALLKALSLSAGSLNIQTKDFANFSAQADIKKIKLPLSQNQQNITALVANIDFNSTALNFEAIDKNISLHYSNKLDIALKDIDIELGALENNQSNEINEIQIIGTNANIKKGKSTLISDHFKYTQAKDTITFENLLYREKLSLKSDKKSLNISSNELSAASVNALIGQNAFSDGSFTLNIYGTDTNHFDGTFLLHNTDIKELQVFNNLMAFINTVPSLITLKNPDFNENGYRVKKGYIAFSKFDDILTLSDINLNGNSADIIGSGFVDLDTGDIDIKLKIAILKSASSLIENIPFLGYILLGKDGKIYTSVHVQGTQENPIITTNVIVDTIMSPLQIIKRTLEFPFQIFSN